MFCPGCGSQVTDDLKFCKQCGANLNNVRDAMTSRSKGEKFDWSKTWWADMLYAPEELERLRGVTIEQKLFKEEKQRLNEIKGGIITSLVGVGIMIFFRVFFGVLANQAPNAEILRVIWMVGIIPFLIGVGLLINGCFVSNRLVKLKEQMLQSAPRPNQASALSSKATDHLVTDESTGSRASVTEDTTAHLPEHGAPALRRDS